MNPKTLNLRTRKWVLDCYPLIHSAPNLLKPFKFLDPLKQVRTLNAQNPKPESPKALGQRAQTPDFQALKP